MNHTRFQYFVISALMATATQTITKAGELEDIKAINEQGIPKVIRCVLDKEPRVLAIQLEGNHNFAYSTWKCHLFKVWKGENGKSIKFTGAVFDGRHGPQPVSIGKTLLKQENASWSHTSGAKLSYIGHKIKGDKTTVLYQFLDNEHNPIAVIEETPSYENGKYTRSISISKLTSGKLIFTADKNSPWKQNGKPVQKLEFDKASSLTLTATF